jgi:hypothetical protein
LLFAEPEAPSLQPGKLRGTDTYAKPMALPAARGRALCPVWRVIAGHLGSHVCRVGLIGRWKGNELLATRIAL